MAKSNVATRAPITGTRTVKPADKRGPKAGSSRSNQTAKLATSDVIDSAKNSTNGSHFCVSAPGQATISLPVGKVPMGGVLAKLGTVGASYSAYSTAVAQIRQAHVAKGVDGANSPHTMKAIADNKVALKGAAPAPAKATAKAATDAKKAERKASPLKAANDRAYTVVNKAHGSKPDSKRAMQLAIVFKHKSTASARKAGAESCDFAFAADKGFIKFS